MCNYGGQKGNKTQSQNLTLEGKESKDLSKSNSLNTVKE